MSAKQEQAVLSSTGPQDRSSTLKDSPGMGNDGFLVKKGLREVDPDTSKIINLEDERQTRKLIFIASESICPLPVREAVASCFSNIYAEGYPAPRMTRDEKDLLLDYGHMLAHQRRYADRRYYKGCDFANFVEALAQKRAAELFATEHHETDGPKVAAKEIFVNVQPLSGAAANNAVYDAFLKPGDTILGLNLAHGGHLTHGSPANRSGKTFRAIAYGLDPKTEQLDYESLASAATLERPKLIVAGFSAYPRVIDWARLREIANEVNALLLADISHPAGLVAAGLFPSPIGYADVVTLTTHKTLCGNRGAIILTTDEVHSQKIDRAVFPGEQGGPHLNAIAGKAVSFLLAQSPEFRALQKGTQENAKALADAFTKEGLRVCNGGTDSHLCLVDLKSLRTDGGQPLSGEIASRILDLAGLTCNKNTIPGDRNAAHPTAIRFGTTWVTQRGLIPQDMQKVAGIVARLLKSIHPFSYLNNRSQIGRGKLDMDILRQCTEEVAGLAQKAAAMAVQTQPSGYPHDFPAQKSTGSSDPGTIARSKEQSNAQIAERNGIQVVLHYSSAEEELKAAREACAVFDLGDHRLLEVIGWRASLFLHEMCAGDILGLDPGEGLKTTVLDRTGTVYGIITVLRKESDKHDRSRYFVVAPPDAEEWLTAWFRSVSDGYVLFDDKDLMRKIQGPVIVFDRTRGEGGPERLKILKAVGPDAEKAMQGLCPDGSPPAPGKIREIPEFSLSLSRSHEGDEFIVTMTESQADLVIRSLVKKGATLAGVSARDLFEPNEGNTQELLKSAPQLFHLNKPYFVGKYALPLPPRGSEKVPFTFFPTAGDPIPSCLYEDHIKLTRPTYMVPFAGWKMPLQYTSINEEHEIVRKAVGLFDVSHMGVLGFSGKHAARFLDLITANYVHWLEDGQAQYSYIFDGEGNVLDDILVYRLGEQRYMMVVNAANTDKVKTWIEAVVAKKVILDHTDPTIEIDVECEIIDLKTEGPIEDRRVDLALQGPNALDVLCAVGGEDQAVSIQQLRRFDFIEGKIGEYNALISRTGYTGEEVGYELYVRPDQASKIWNLLLEKGAAHGIRPVGLGARDSTRAEAGLPLYGHELGGKLDLIPSEAGYGSFVKLHKPFFVGRSAYIERMEASTRTIVRFRLDSSSARRIKPGDPIVDSKGSYIGEVTSSVLVQGNQQGLACIQKKAAKKDAGIQIFPVPEKGRAGKIFAPAELNNAPRGAKAVLPENATIVTRFLKGQKRLPRITARRNQEVKEAARNR